MVMSASDEAATIQTVTGWVSRLGNFWGNDERMARYDGSTHHLCDCAAMITKHDLKCEACRNAAEIERYNAMPQAAWDGIDPLYSDAHDRYFFCNDELADFIYEHGGDIASLRFIICQPLHATPLDHDHWCDDLPEDGDMPGALAAAIDALNAVVATLEPLSYEPSKNAATVESVGVVTAPAIARVAQC
jgi:hypothetical protein